MTNPSLLSQRLHILTQRTSLDPQYIAALLGTKLGPARQPAPERTEYDVLTTQIITAGRIATANQWCMIALRFAPALGLTLQDLEPLFLDAPYRMTIATAQRSDGVAITSLDHQFRVPAGMLVVRVPPAPPSLPTHGEEVGRAYGDRWDTVAGKRTASDPVIELVVTTQPSPGLEKEPTLGTFQHQVHRSDAVERCSLTIHLDDTPRAAVSIAMPPREVIKILRHKGHDWLLLTGLAPFAARGLHGAQPTALELDIAHEVESLLQHYLDVEAAFQTGATTRLCTYLDDGFEFSAQLDPERVHCRTGMFRDAFQAPWRDDGVEMDPRVHLALWRSFAHGIVAML